MAKGNGQRKLVKVTIDGRDVVCSENARILDVARREQIYVPTLCWDERLQPYGACRVCMVGVEGARGPVAACTTLVREGMVIDTQDPVATRVARNVVELVLSDYPAEALAREGQRNELRDVARHFGLTSSRYSGERHQYAKDDRHPYIKMDLNECIVCGRCVRACDEIQGTFALTYAKRGFDTKIVVGVDKSFVESACVSCGACVSACPTGALDEAAFKARETLDKTVRTTCSYCGVGCGLDVNVRDGQVVAIDPAMDGPANHGHTCLKGRFAHQFALAPDRLRTPLLRRGDGTLAEATWDEALDFTVGRMLAIRDAHGPDALCAVSSSRCTNEENYSVQKMMRAAIGTNNIDNCSRVCHSPTSYSLLRLFGESGGTACFDDIDAANVLLITGANPTEGHPVVGARMKARVLAGARLIVIDPRRIELAKMADMHLQIRPGSNVAVFNGLAHVIVRDGLCDLDFLGRHVADFDAFAEHIRRYDPAFVESVSGIAAEDIEKTAHLFAASRPGVIAYGLGITEQKQGAQGVQSLANLATLTGNVGVVGGGVLPLRGQNNVQGGSDMGALPNCFTMYRPVTDDAVRGQFESKWGVKLSAKVGYKIPEMFQAAISGELKAMYCFGEDIAQTDPNTHHVVQALTNLELLVVHDIFVNATAEFAHVVLPGSSFLEKTGTFTNAERLTQMVRAAVEPPGAARQDLWIIQELTRRLGYDYGFPDAAAVMDEIAELTPKWAGISHQRLGTQGLHWPVWGPQHPGTPRLFEGGTFSHVDGKALLARVDYIDPGETTSEHFPFILVTGRQLAHYNCGTMTRRTANLELHPEDCLEMAADDCARLGIADGDYVEITGERGAVRTHVWITDRVMPGYVFMSFHFPEVRTNLLTSDVSDEFTSCPEYKVTAVRVDRLPQVAAPAARALASGIRPGLWPSGRTPQSPFPGYVGGR